MKKQILFIIDEIELKYFEFNDLVTNFWFIKEFLKRDFDVSISTKNRLYIENKNACALFFDAYLKDENIFYRKEEKTKRINDFDIVFFRPDPPVDVDYINACYVFDFVDREKTLLINDPSSIKNFNEKFHINLFPDYIPKNIITSSKELIKNFVKQQNEAVIKPLNRCFGSGVYYLNKDDKNLNSIISSITNDGKTSVMVQEYLPKAVHGDKRILITGETVYEECVTKLPGEDDFKFNTHSSKFFAPASLTPKERELAEHVAREFTKRKLYLVGIDVIDEKITEINVTSPCYFIKEINTLYNTNFENKLMSDILSLIERHFAKNKTVCMMK